MSLFFIVNPASAQGKGKSEFEKVKDFIEKTVKEVTILYTEYPLHAVELTKRALKSGATKIISFGGDGTHNEVLNGLLKGAEGIFNKSIFEFSAQEKELLPPLGFVSIGSGNDFRKTIKIPKDTLGALKIALQDHYKNIDVGYFEYENFSQRPSGRFFLNILSGGFSGVVTDRANKNKKSILRGFVYSYALLSTLLFITIPEGILSIKNRVIDGKFFEFVIANGKFFGGGMLISPKADVEDGLLNITLFKNYSGFEILFKIPKLFNGSILTEKKLYHDFAKEIFVKTEPKSIVEVDGEVVGYTPVKASVIEKAIKVAI